MVPEKYILGIDLGTTSVKVCVINIRDNSVVTSNQKDTQANVPSDQGIDGNKQDLPKIISALNVCVAKLPKDILQQVERIGICGQMHGVLFWNHRKNTKAWEKIIKDKNLVRYDVRPEQVSNLYTWQDNRCDAAFLESLPTPASHLKTYTGFGIATIFWMMRNKPEELHKYDYAGSVQDFAVAMLCDKQMPSMSYQTAASWGYFDCVKKCWNLDILSKASFPTGLLPLIKSEGDIAGALAETWHSIPKGTPVGVGLGDVQCSALSAMESSRDAILNISTSAQIAFVAENFVAKSGPPENQAIMYVPYFDNQYLAVAASLNGGNALATFVKMLQQWSLELGHSIPQARVWEKLLTLSSEEDTKSLKIVPTCLGERHAPEAMASISNINIGNLGLGTMFKALCEGVVENLLVMMPKDKLKEAKIKRIVGNGSGLRRNPVLQATVKELYGLPLVLSNNEDAAKGAAMAMYLPPSRNLDN